MNTRTVLALTLVSVLTVPLTAHAQSKPKSHSMLISSVTHSKMAAAPMYECPICHHKVNAAQAKKLHYTCPVDHGKLALVKTAKARA